MTTMTLTHAGADRLIGLITDGEIKATREIRDGKPVFVIEHRDVEDYLTNGGAA